MIIDFHTHIWPDAVASKAMEKLTHVSDACFNPVTDGTLKSLLSRMDEWHIDYSLIQPVVTKSSQIKTVNEFAYSINTGAETSRRFVSFGGLWPHSENYKQDIDYIVSLGIKGIKLHPEYQSFEVDDPAMLKVYDYALSKDLILLFHAGADPAFSEPYRSSPEKFASVIDNLNGGKIVLAHMGGHLQYQRLEVNLVGKNVFLDTSMGFDYYPKDWFVQVVKRHGSDKILFASDSPWSNAKREYDTINALPLLQEEKDNIFYKNACRLLKI
ncbi:MAG: amidohydrolase family protein [Spirochaetaceae bacterium]|nr:amidohydrolase family protein [Spirochaetaceae bacterium]